MNVTIDPKSVSLFIATPTYDAKVESAYALSLVETADTLARAGVRWQPKMFAGAPTPQARNILTAKFMVTGYSHLLFIDSDMSWRAESVTKLIGASQYHEICCGVGPKKCKPLAFAANFVVVDNGPVEHPETGYWEMQDVGAGFLMITRSAIEKMIAAYPERKTIFGDDHPEEQKRWEYNLFDQFTDTDGHFLSEDFGFCRLWQRIGGKVWADPNISLGHHGYAYYDGKISDLVVQS